MNNPKFRLSDAVQEQLSEPTSRTASHSPAAVEAIPVAELAKRTVPLHLHPSRVLPSHFTDAIERQYSPATTFWFHIDAERFVSELESHNPTYMKALATSWESWGCGVFNEDLVNSIRTKQFDEYCAAWLLSLPQGQVSSDDDEIYELLHGHLKAAGEFIHVRYLELDGVKAVRYIRDRMGSIVS